jgi:hypothetical protein
MQPAMSQFLLALVVGSKLAIVVIDDAGVVTTVVALVQL